jgi:hypothetical protein
MPNPKVEFFSPSGGKFSSFIESNFFLLQGGRFARRVGIGVPHGASPSRVGVRHGMAV